MSQLRWIFGFLTALIVAMLAVSNRHAVDLYLLPFQDSFQYPLYVVLLAMLGFGFVLGSFAVWFNEAPVRRVKRQQKHKIKDLEKALAGTEDKNPGQAPASELFPALPRK